MSWAQLAFGVLVVLIGVFLLVASSETAVTQAVYQSVRGQWWQILLGIAIILFGILVVYLTWVEKVEVFRATGRIRSTKRRLGRCTPCVPLLCHRVALRRWHSPVRAKESRGSHHLPPQSPLSSPSFRFLASVVLFDRELRDLTGVRARGLGARDGITRESRYYRVEFSFADGTKVRTLETRTLVVSMQYVDSLDLYLAAIGFFPRIGGPEEAEEDDEEALRHAHARHTRHQRREHELAAFEREEHEEGAAAARHHERSRDRHHERGDVVRPAAGTVALPPPGESAVVVVGKGDEGSGRPSEPTEH